MTIRAIASAVLLAATATAQSWVLHDPRLQSRGTITYDARRGRGVYALDTGSRFESHEWSGERWTPRFPGGPNGPGTTTHLRRSLACDPALVRTAVPGSPPALVAFGLGE